MFTESQLKDLTIYLRKTAKELPKTEDDPNEDEYNQIMDMVKQIEVLYYNPIIFQDILESYDVPYNLMEESLDTIPLRINDAGALSKALIQWRLTNGI